MTRKSLLIVGIGLLVLVAVGAVAYVVSSAEDEPGGAAVGPLESVSPDKTDGQTFTPTSDEALPEPVPMEVVEVLFDLIEASGTELREDETYTVEYIRDVEHVRVSGEFGEGVAETFDFSLGEDETWQLDG